MQLRSVAGLWWHPSKELICKEHSVELAGALKWRQETQVASPVALRRHGGQDLVAAGLERFLMSRNSIFSCQETILLRGSHRGQQHGGLFVRGFHVTEAFHPKGGPLGASAPAWRGVAPWGGWPPHPRRTSSLCW